MGQKHRLRRFLTALALLLAPGAAMAQAAPEFPGLRGIGPLQAYIGFIGRSAAIAECGFTEAYSAELMASIARELAPAGVTMAPGAERVPMTNGLLVRTPGYAPGSPTLAITAATLNVAVGQTQICAAAIGFVLRANGAGIAIAATGNRYDGDVAVWIDDAAQLRDAGSITPTVRTSILTAVQGLARAITAANAATMACPGPLNAAPNAPARFTCACSAAAASTVAPIWGVDVYTDDSAVCVAAVHAGAIGPGGGVITVSRARGQQSYPGRARNGVVSHDYGPLGQSFRVERGEPPAAPSTNPRAPGTK